MEKFYYFTDITEGAWAKVEFLGTFDREIPKCPSCNRNLDRERPYLVPPISVRFLTSAATIPDRIKTGFGVGFVSAILVSERLKEYCLAKGYPVGFHDVEVLPSKTKKLVPKLPLPGKLYRPYAMVKAHRDMTLSKLKEEIRLCPECGNSVSIEWENRVWFGDEPLTIFGVDGAPEALYITETVHRDFLEQGFTGMDGWIPAGELRD